MNLIRTSRKARGTSLMLAASFLFFSINPSISYGLSMGPGQPELEGFSPIGLDNMVDVFSGDFSYNIPLLNVPGPDGGYPLNLSYAAGIQMEQEASWVGLGWNLNPGVVNREVRGLPDDFNGQKVIKKLHQRPNQTFGANIAAVDLEAFGADAKKVGLNVSGNVNLLYNNYRGFDVQAGLGFSLVDAKDRKSANSASEEEPVDPETGEKKGTPSYPDKVEENKSKDEKKLTFANIKQNFADHYQKVKVRTKRNPGGLLSSAGSPTVSDINYQHPMTSSSYTLNVKTGIEVAGVSGDLQVNAYFNELKVSQDGENMSVPAYGYLFSEHNLSNDQSGLMDFTLGNQSMLTPASKILPIPNHTYDVFHVKSQGISGTVRAYKGGVSKLVDPTVTSGKKNIGAGGEVNSLAAFNKVGLNLNGGGGKSYTGPWQEGDEEISFLNSTLEDKRDKENQLLEPYYFKFANELTSQTNKSSIFTDEGAASLDLDTRMGGVANEARLESDLSGSHTSALTTQNAYRNARELRAKSFMALTEAEARAFDGYTRSVQDITSPTSTIDIDFATSSTPEKDRIGAIHVTDENGTRYIYGIPAKNTLQKQTTFSTGAIYGSTLSTLIGKTKSYNSKENSVANEQGTDHFYSATETPEHAHSYLLTEIVSPDYADINENGPDKTDFGSYVKFNYLVKEGFKTKSPIQGANYLPGKLSNEGDEKATITYFEKDLYYLGSVETKTHIAVFNLASRADAWGVSGENGGPSSSQYQYKLESITLYNLDDYNENGTSAKPLKTVHFGYDYSLFGNGSLPNSTAGKLTLRKVWYTVGSEKTKMSLSPYEFEYDSVYNYDYDETHVDRWAMYQDDTSNTFGSNVLYPYTTKNKSAADQYAAAWNLSGIKLPTGGRINVTYEVDDYQYVQNTRAQSMCKIKGFVNSSGATVGAVSNALNKNDRWMVVELPETIQYQHEADKYVQGLERVYFKAFMEMKKFGSPGLAPSSTTPFNNSDRAYDFVDGYAELESGASLFDPDPEGLTNMIAIKLKKSGDYHPIQKAGWIDLQLSRKDLLDDSNFDLSGFSNMSSSVLGAIGSIVSKAVEFLIDENSFFVKANAKNWCGYLSNAGGLSSIVRLNVPDKKIGGGHRVKSVEISDEWAAMGGDTSFTYGQNYYYELEDGSSSGVAQYEPLTGGEENPFRQPVRYSTDKQTFKNSDLYTELPVGEDFFPSASVGYSRVVVINKANEVVTTGGTGVMVHEFYTAKDYPVQTDYTPVKTVNTDFTAKLIRFIGNKRYFQPGFSQGFKVEVNNMHGQKKSEASYSAYSDYDNDAPEHKIEYFYRTSKGGYYPGKNNRLDNKVTVFLGDNVSKQENVGITQDTYVYLKESKESAFSGAIDGDLDITLPFVFIPTAWPTIDYTHSMTRLVVMNKVISKTGILERVETTKNGAKTVKENLAYDYETGIPIVSSVTNEFGNRVFTYNQMAKWHYPRMAGKYKNEGLYLDSNAITVGDHYFVPGDVLINEVTGNKLWVTEAPNGDLVLRKKNGTLASTYYGYRIIKSGYSNQLNESVGYVQTLGDPRELKGNLSVFYEYNKQIVGTSKTSYPFTDKEYNISVNVDVSYNTTPIFQQVFKQGTQTTSWEDGDEVIGYTHSITIDDLDTSEPYNKGGVANNLFGSNPGDDLCIVAVFDVPSAYPNANEFELYYIGNKRMMALHPDGYSVEFDYYEHCSCHEEPFACFGWYDGPFVGILNASASEFSDSLKVNDLVNAASSSDTAGMSLNPYAYGMRGFYKPFRTYFFPQSRIQTGSAYNYDTKIQEDGEYTNFRWFIPESPMNIGWLPSGQVRKYDHNGVAIEEEDALGNYSAVLYGYNRSLPIAVAKNARHNELAYDGFEDHESGTGTFLSPTYDTGKKDNHLNLGSDVILSTEGDAHTGNYSVEVNTASVVSVPLNMTNGLQLDPGKTYVVQAWKKANTAGDLAIKVDSGPQVLAGTISTNIDGWELIEVVFTAGMNNTLKLSGSGLQLDDLKLHPVNASAKAFVYDKYTHKVTAALDENHFATLYNYDRDQTLIQVKKETERGIKTIQSTMQVNAKGSVQ